MTFALRLSNDEMQLAVVWLPSAFSVKKKPRQDWKRDRGRATVLKVSAINIVLNWRWMPDGICSRGRQTKSMEVSYVCFRNQWTPWKHWPVQIRVRPSISPLLIDMPNVNRAGSEGDNSRSLIGSLSAALLGGNVCPPNVLITQSNPFPPQWGPLRLLSFFNLFQFGLFIRSTPARFTLTLSLTISLHSLPFPPSSSLRLSYHNRYRQGIRLPFNTRAERDSDQVEWF